MSLRWPLARWWCILTLRHRGRIDHDRRGIFWECDNCWWRSYVDWRSAMRDLP